MTEIPVAAATVCGVMALLGGAGGVKALLDSKKATCETTARVIDYAVEYSSDEHGSHEVNYPILNYRVGGQEYNEKHNVGRSGRPYPIGTELTIKYNPDKPQSFHIAGQKSHILIPFVVGAAGLVFVVLFALQRFGVI